MEFYITLEVSFNRYQILVKQVKCTKHIEEYDFISKQRTIRVRGNRPFLQSRGLKHKKIQWKIVQGQVLYMSVYDKAIEKLEAVLKEKY